MMYDEQMIDTSPLLDEKPKKRWNGMINLFRFLFLLCIVGGLVAVLKSYRPVIKKETSVGSMAPEEDVGAYTGNNQLLGITYDKKRPSWTVNGGKQLHPGLNQHRCHILSSYDIFRMVDQGGADTLRQLWNLGAWPNPAVNKPKKQFNILFNALQNLRLGDGSVNTSIQEFFDPDFDYNSSSGVFTLTQNTKNILNVLAATPALGALVSQPDVIAAGGGIINAVRTSGGNNNNANVVLFSSIDSNDYNLLKSVFPGYFP